MTEIEKLLFELFDGKLHYADFQTIKLWQEQGATLTDIVKAYGIMMKHCEKPAFSYMSKVIINNLDN